jgi:Calx-beta domain
MNGRRAQFLRRAAAGALVVLALATLASLGYASAKKLSLLQYNYQYCTTPSQYAYCSTSTSTTTTTTPTSTSTSTITSTTTTPTTTSTSTITSTTTTPTTTSTSTSTSTSTTTPTSTKPGKGCGDKNHLHDRRFQCKVVISGVSKKEGKAGTTTVFSFPVTLSAAALSPVTISYTTTQGTAVAPSDYVARAGTLTFPTGTSVAKINITVNGDKLKEANETFLVKISNPSANAYLGDTQATGTILNDD